MSGVLLIDRSTSTVNGALWNTASVCMVLRVNLPRETSSRTLKTACHNIPNSSRHPRLTIMHRFLRLGSLVWERERSNYKSGASVLITYTFLTEDAYGCDETERQHQPPPAIGSHVPISDPTPQKKEKKRKKKIKQFEKKRLLLSID